MAGDHLITSRETVILGRTIKRQDTSFVQVDANLGRSTKQQETSSVQVDK
jgi:hypothetical protein